MKLPRSLESFGFFPFLFYTFLGFIFYWLITFVARSSDLGDSLRVITGSWLFLIFAGFGFGLTTIAALTRFTPYVRKTWGLLIGGLLPLFEGHWGDIPFLASLTLGFLLGVGFIGQQKRQLKWTKAFAPLPLFVLLIPPISEITLEVQRGTYIQHIKMIIGYTSIVILVLVEAWLVHATARHAFRDEETSEEITIFLGPRQSGKTILSLGFYYALVTKRIGTYDNRKSFSISEEGAPIDLSELYSIFRRRGFQGVVGTRLGWLTINVFKIRRKTLEKFIHGLKDVELEITDYAGETIWTIEEVLKDPKKYDDLVNAVEQDIEADLESFKNAMKFRGSPSDEEKNVLATRLKERILKDLRSMDFDFRTYKKDLYWEKIPENIRANLAVAHTLSNLLRADKIVPLLDGAAILYELYNRDREAREALEDLQKSNPALYELIMSTIERFERAERALDTSLEARKATLEAQLRAYDVILSEFNRRNRRGDFAFLVTKADLIGSIFMPYLLQINLQGVKKRIINILKSTTAFINLASKLIPEKSLREKLMVSIILSPADLKQIDPESAEELREEILVRGLDELIEWVRKASKDRLLKEVLLP